MKPLSVMALGLFLAFHSYAKDSLKRPAAHDTPVHDITLIFSDLPQDDTFHFPAKQRDYAILDKLSRSHLQKVGFFCHPLISLTDGQQKRLRSISDAGHFIGFDLRGQSKPSVVLDWKQIDLRFSIFHQMKNFILIGGGGGSGGGGAPPQRLKTFPWTLDVGDRFLNLAYEMRQGAYLPTDAAKLQKAYIRLFTDALAGRPGKQIIKLQENDLAAMYLDKLIAAVQKAGWNFVPSLSAHDWAVKPQTSAVALTSLVQARAYLSAAGVFSEPPHQSPEE